MERPLGDALQHTVFRLDDPDRRWDDVLSLDADDGASPGLSLAAVLDDERGGGHLAWRAGPAPEETPGARDAPPPAALVLHLRRKRWIAAMLRDAPRAAAYARGASRSLSLIHI